MASQPSSEDKLALLYYFRKMYRQRLVKTHVGYQKGLISIKEQVLNWLKEEIYFLRKISPKNQLPDVEEKTKVHKISTRLSVSQVAYVLKVMHELGLITAKSQWDMFRFVQENISSKKTDTIYAHRLNNKYYNVEGATKTSIKELLLRMLHHINTSK